MEPSQFLRLIFGLVQGLDRHALNGYANLTAKQSTYGAQKVKNKGRAFESNFPMKFGGPGMKVGSDHSYRTVKRVKWALLLVFYLCDIARL